MVAKNDVGDSRVSAVKTQINRQYGKGSIVELGEARDESEEKVVSILTGSIGLDLATGIGGYPKGRVIEIFGPESSGKTTLALHAIAESQRADGVAAFIDTDHAFDPAYARAVGVLVDKLLVSQPDTAEQAYDIAEVLARSGAVDLIVFDSVPNLTPKQEIEGEFSADDAGLRARLMSQTLRKLTAICHRTGTAILFVNTLRKVHVVTPYGSEYGSTSSNALKFYATMRLDVRRGIESSQESDPIRGVTPRPTPKVHVKLVKNKCAAPFTDARFAIRYGEGIDREGELLDLGVDRGVVEKNGEHYVFAGRLLGRGRERARECLRAETELRDTVRQAVLAAEMAS